MGPRFDRSRPFCQHYESVDSTKGLFGLRRHGIVLLRATGVDPEGFHPLVQYFLEKKRHSHHGVWALGSHRVFTSRQICWHWTAAVSTDDTSPRYAWKTVVCFRLPARILVEGDDPLVPIDQCRYGTRDFPPTDSSLGRLRTRVDIHRATPFASRSRARSHSSTMSGQLRKITFMP